MKSFKKDHPNHKDECFEQILKNLNTGTTPETMENYPHETPFIIEMETEE
jgi:hypothetical protein